MMKSIQDIRLQMSSNYRIDWFNNFWVSAIHFKVYGEEKLDAPIKLVIKNKEYKPFEHVTIDE